jgi:hypothetical protein
VDDLEYLIEQKMLEFFGDPDSGLILKIECREELLRRLKNRRPKITHQEVVRRFG